MPPASTICLAGAELADWLELDVDASGNVGATVGATVGASGSTVGSGLGVCNTHAVRPMAAKDDIMRDFNFILERIT